MQKFSGTGRYRKGKRQQSTAFTGGIIQIYYEKRPLSYKIGAGLPAQPLGFRRPTDKQAALRQDAEPPIALSVYEIVGIQGCDDRDQYVF